MRRWFDQLPLMTSADQMKFKLANAVVVAARISAGAKLGGFN